MKSLSKKSIGRVSLQESIEVGFAHCGTWSWLFRWCFIVLILFVDQGRRSASNPNGHLLITRGPISFGKTEEVSRKVNTL